MCLALVLVYQMFFCLTMEASLRDAVKLSLSRSKTQEGKWVLEIQVQGGMMSVIMFISEECSRSQGKAG